MTVEENLKLKEYKELIEIIAKVEYQKFSNSHLVELPELINIGTHALYILLKVKILQNLTILTFLRLSNGLFETK